MALIETKLVTVHNGSAIIRAATPEDAEQLEVLNPAIDRETELLMRSPGELKLTLDEHRHERMHLEGLQDTMVMARVRARSN